MRQYRRNVNVSELLYHLGMRARSTKRSLKEMRRSFGRQIDSCVLRSSS